MPDWHHGSDTLRVPHLASRNRDAGMPCPRCGAPVKVREIAARHSERPDELEAWIVTSRFCTAGCILLSADLDLEPPDD